MRSNPAITIIMWCYNNEENIKNAVDSILNQSFSNFELTIVNDHSHDRTQHIIEDIHDGRVKIVTNRAHIGKYRVYNKYLKSAESKYISFVDASFGFTHQKLAIQYDFLEKHPLVGCLGAQIKPSAQNSDNSTGEPTPEKHEDIKISLLKHNPFILSSLVFRASLLVNQNLLFKNELGDWAFYDFMINASKNFRTFNLKDELLIMYSTTDAPKIFREKSHKYRDRLIIQQLTDFHIKPKKDKATLHLKLMTNQRLLANEVEPMCLWLNKLMDLNAEHKYYSPGKLYKFFNMILKEKVATHLPNINWITRSQVLNELIKKYNYGSYLEIGVFDPKQNFDLINCTQKTGVDPEALRDDIIGATSDDFFKTLSQSVQYDLVFIDGLHHSDQVTRDIENALRHLSDQGTIVCHDMLPEDEEMQAVPRQTVKWMGDCWKSWACFRMTNHNLTMYVIDSDCGIGIIRRGTQKVFKADITHQGLTYFFFTKWRNKLMNVISPAIFLQKLINSTL
jgi:glycosyltransferase involved in cell wall biosynthesis